MEHNFFLFLLEEEELKGYFSDWPEKMLIAVSADADEGFSLVLYRQEEQDDVFKRLARSKDMELSDLHIIPKMDGFPSLNILFSQEQEIVNMVRDNQGILDAAEDYSINFQFAVDEGLTGQQLLPDNPVEDEASEEESVSAETSEASQSAEVDTSEQSVDKKADDGQHEAKVAVLPKREDKAAPKVKVISGPKEIDPVSAQPAKEEVPDATEGQAAPKDVATAPEEGKAPSADHSFLTPEEAAQVVQIDAFVRNKGHKYEISSSTDRNRIKGPLHNVLIRDDLSCFLVQEREDEDSSKLLKAGFSVATADFPEALKVKLATDDQWQPVTITTHKLGLLVSPIARTPEVASETTDAEVPTAYKGPSFMRRVTEHAVAIAAAVALAIGFNYDYKALFLREEPALVTADMTNEYMEQLREKIFAASP